MSTTPKCTETTVHMGTIALLGPDRNQDRLEAVDGFTGPGPDGPESFTYIF